MFWNDDPSAVATAPAVPAPTGQGHSYFTNGNPVTGVAGTIVPDWFLNQTQEEPLAVLAAAGITPAKGTNNQLLAALRALFAPASAVGGRYIGRQIFTSSGSYTPSTGTGLIRIRMVGAGGGAGGAQSNSGTASSASCPGGAGGEIEALISTGQLSLPVPITIGSGGLGGTGSANGATGGGTLFGTFGGTGSVLVGGGSGGATGPSVSAGSSAQLGQTFGGTVSYGSFTNGLILKAKTGNIGPNAIVLSNGSGVPINLPGIGASSEFGSGGANTNTGNGGNGQGYGSGGGGCGSINGNAYTGGNGAPGYMIIEEFS